MKSERIIDPQSEPDLARREAFLLPGVVRESTHPFQTNRKSNYYIDIDPMLANPVECERIVQWFANSIWGIRADHPEGSLDMLAFIEKDRDPGSVGVIQAAGAISIATQTPYVIVRLGKEIPLTPRFSGKTFALLTDLCTEGDETLRAVSVIDTNGGKTSDLLTYSIIAPHSQQPLFRERNIRLHSFLEAPADLYQFQPRLGFELK